MRRTFVTCLAVALCLSLGASTVGGVPDARLTVDDATIAPDRPTTGEPTTVSATVSLSAGSDSPVELDRVALVAADGDRLAAAGDPGSLSPGDSLTLDLVTAFETAGRKDLTVHVRGEDDDGDTVTVERPVTVVVEDSPPGITVDGDLVVGVDSPVTVTVANPAVDQVRNVEIVVIKGTATADRAFVPAIAAGGTTTANLSVTPTNRDQSIAVRISYTTVTGDRQRTVRRESLAADPLRDDVGLRITRATADADAPDGAGGGLGGLIGATGGAGLQQNGDDDRAPPERVEVTVTNFGNAPVTGAVVGPAGNASFARQFLGTLAPGESDTATLDLTTVPPGAVDVAVTYRLDGERRRTVRTYDYRPATAAITLTGVDMSRSGDRLNISGNAGNTGDAPVDGVVVALGTADGVRPTYPQRDYFVGTVEGSEFAPFELTATVADDATTVPVTVTYRVDGEQRTDRTTLPIEPERDDDRGGLAGRSPLLLAVVIAVPLVVGAGILLSLYVRRR